MRKQPECNLDLITDLMTYSKFGPLSEVFIMTAIQKYTEQITSLTHGELMRQMGEHPIIKPTTWSDMAHDVQQRMDAFYNRNLEATAPVSSFDPDDIAMNAAFMMEGLRESGNYTALLKIWNQGAIELVSQLAEYAEPIARLEKAAISVYEDSPSYPGVFAYEVVSPFGGWIGRHVYAHSKMPEQEQALNWLSNTILEFFGKDQELSDVDKDAMGEAIHQECLSILNQ
jgi:hypothetical protein